MSWKIYHNPRCSKSRETLALLEGKGIKPEIVEYLKEPLTEVEILALIKLLPGKVEEIVRVKEEAFLEAKFDTSDVRQIAKNIAKHPVLMERPIVVHGKKAVIARPPEKVKDLF